MSVRTTVHLLRHAEVDNPSRVLYGRLPGFHLSPRGHAQAADVAAHLAGGPPLSAVLSSPLERALETAAPVAAAAGVEVEVEVDERLVESANVFQGADLGFRLAHLAPAQWRYYVDPRRPSWGESYRNVAHRMLAVVDEVRRAHPGGVVVCVSHQSPIWVARRALEGRVLWHDPRRRQCDLASLTTLTFDGGELTGVGYCEPTVSR
jgi:broad specificity phosphatase PhoE